MTATTETKYLKVTFTREQRAEFALELARKTQHLGELDQQKKEVAAALKAQIEEEVAKQQKLARYVNDGYDFRDVEVHWMMNYPRNGQKTAVRLDTEETTGIVEAMTDQERQADLPFDDEPAPKGRSDARQSVSSHWHCRFRRAAYGFGPVNSWSVRGYLVSVSCWH